MIKVIQTPLAPAAIGCYSQAVAAGGFIFLSGQIALDPSSQQMVTGGISAELKQVFKNMEAVITASNATFADVVKLTVYLKDLAHFSLVNETMKTHFKEPYPARAAIQVADLPKGALVEIDGIVQIPASK